MKILVVGDAHFPWCNQSTLQVIVEKAKRDKPDVVVQIGDLYDLFSFSRFSRSLNLIKPKEEIESARGWADYFWSEMKDASPKAKCYQIMGNHDIRIKERIKEKIPELADIFDIDRLWKFKGVKTITDPREELIVNDIVFVHGYRSKLGDQARYMSRRVVVGHTHRGGVVHFNSHQGPIWELNCGFLGDPTSPPMTYTKQKFTHWTQGYGWIDEEGPRFCPV